METFLTPLTPAKTLRINVGGILHEVWGETLRKFPHSKLASETEMVEHYREEERDYFFDRHPSAFAEILNYHRTGALHIPQNVCPSVFQKELDYWGICVTDLEDCCWLEYSAHNETLSSLKKVQESEKQKGSFLASDQEMNYSMVGPWRRFQLKAWTVLSDPHSSVLAKVYAAVAVGFIILSLFVFVAATHPAFYLPMRANDYADLYKVSNKEIIEDWGPEMFKNGPLKNWLVKNNYDYIFEDAWKESSSDSSNKKLVQTETSSKAQKSHEGEEKEDWNKTSTESSSVSSNKELVQAETITEAPKSHEGEGKEDWSITSTESSSFSSNKELVQAEATTEAPISHGGAGKVTSGKKLRKKRETAAEKLGEEIRDGFQNPGKDFSHLELIHYHAQELERLRNAMMKNNVERSRVRRNVDDINGTSTSNNNSTSEHRYAQQSFLRRPLPALVYIDYVCFAFFLLDFALRAICCPCKTIFLKSVLNWMDAIVNMSYAMELILESIFPGEKYKESVLDLCTALRVLRIMRIIRLFRFSRGLRLIILTVRSSLNEMIQLCLFLGTGILFFASLVFYADGIGSSFTSIPDACWWSVVTMTTVGYGDLYPTTFLGRIVGTLCAVSGVLVIGFTVPVIVNNFLLFSDFMSAERNASKSKQVSPIHRKRYGKEETEEEVI